MTGMRNVCYCVLIRFCFSAKSFNVTIAVHLPKSIVSPWSEGFKVSVLNMACAIFLLRGSSGTSRPKSPRYGKLCNIEIKGMFQCDR